MTDDSYKKALGELLEDVLDRNLGRVLAGRASVQECCAASPEFAGALRPLLESALAARQALFENVPLEVRDSVWDRIVSRNRIVSRKGSLKNVRVPGGGGARSGRAFARRRIVRPLALSGASFILLFSGTALAASGAGPDSVLYPLKQRLEAVRTDLAWSNQDRARTEISHANARLDELQTMVNDNKTEYIPGMLARYGTNINAAAEYAKAAADNGEDTAEIDAMIHSTRVRHDEMLASMEDKVPAEEARALRESMDLPVSGGSEEQTGRGDSSGAVDGGNRSESGDVESHDSGASGRGDSGHQDSGSGDGGHYDSGSSGGNDSPGSPHGGESSHDYEQPAPSGSPDFHDQANKSESHPEAVHPEASMAPSNSLGQGNAGR